MKKIFIGLVSSVLGGVAASGATIKLMSKAVNEKAEMSDKHLSLFLLMNQWVKLKQDGKDLIKYFEKNNYRTIAIYGMSYVGETLARELENTNISVKYAIDQKADRIYADIDLVTIDDDLEEVDAIVVTPIYFYDEIEDKLSGKVSCPIISLEDILYEI